MPLGIYSRPYREQFIIKRYIDGSYKLICGKFVEKEFTEFYDDEKKYYKKLSEKLLQQECPFENDFTPIQSGNKLNNNLSRARTMIFDYILSNQFDYFCTFTIDPDKYDRTQLDVFYQDFSHFIRNLRRSYPQHKFNYLFIPELHKDKKSWHLHGVLGDIPFEILERFEDSKKLPYYIRKNIDTLYNFPKYQKRFGFCCLEKIKDNRKCASYITKYVSKELGQGLELNHKVFYHSRGLKLPEKQKFKALPITSNNFDFSNEYVSIKTFNDIIELQGFFINNNIDSITSLDNLQEWIFNKEK